MTAPATPVARMPIANEAPTQRNRAGVAPSPATAKKAPVAWTMPSVSQGAMVRWFTDRFTDAFHIGFVSEVGDRAIGVTLIIPGSINVMPYTGVRHKSDPAHDAIDAIGQGVWDYVENDLSAKVAALVERVATLEAVVAGPSTPSK